MSQQEARERAWVSVILFLAAIYNVIWGTVAAVAPAEMLVAAGIANPSHPEFWQCIGMFVALYGMGYWFVSTDPVRYWPFVLIGLAGKIAGPAGAVVAIASGHLPREFLWINLGNDFVWWIPFAWTLRAIHRWSRNRSTAPLYGRLIGPVFDGLTPQLRRFHDATRPVEVRGVFRATRGASVFGNWLTDLARFPRSHEALEVSLTVDPHPDREIWRRSFARTVVESRQFEANGLLAERFGAITIYLQPRVVDGALEITDVRSTFLGAPLPPFLAPRVFARGIDSGPGVEVAVRLSCSPFGLLIEYRGVVSMDGHAAASASNAGP